MPDFVSPRRGVRQTVDSAVPSLAAIGVEPGQLVLRSAGAGWLPGTIVGQEPAPGTPLARETRVVLHVAGSGALDSLPFALREDSDDEMRVDALLALFDDPIHKLGYTVRRGGGFLQLHPDDAPGALRWIEGIFHVSARPWAKRRWYEVARLLPALHRVAGREGAIALALRLVFELPVHAVRLVPRIVPLPADRRTRLGTRNGRLGFDAAVGAGRLVSTGVLVTIGPVSLDAYHEHRAERERLERQAVYRLVLPAHMHESVTERWMVGERGEPARLRDAWQPAALGLNSYLGGRRPGSVA